MIVIVNNNKFEVILVGLPKVFKIKKDGSRGKVLMPGLPAWNAAVAAAKAGE